MGWERAHGHARAVGGAHGSRAEIVGLPLEVPVGSGTGAPAAKHKEEAPPLAQRDPAWAPNRVRRGERARRATLPSGL